MNDLDLFLCFNVDMVAAGVMDPKSAKGNNRFLIRYKRKKKTEEPGPDEIPAKINPKTGEIVSATPERRALLEAHRRRVQEGMRVHGKR